MLGTYRLPVSLLLCCSILFLCQSSGEEEEGGLEGRNPLANDSWDLGHVLNLDTNVGSFYSPSVICFMCLPNTGTGLASLSPPSISISYITYRSWMSTRPQVPCTFSHSQLKSCGSILQYEAVWRDVGRESEGEGEKKKSCRVRSINLPIYVVSVRRGDVLGRKEKKWDKGYGKVIIR